MIKLHLTLLLALSSLCACDRVSGGGSTGAGSAAPSATAAAAATGDELALLTAAAPRPPFNDKKILTVTVKEPWAKASDGVRETTDHLVAEVKVFDPRNRKCWTWKRVYFRRPAGGGAVTFERASHETADVAEIACSSAGFTPP